MVFHFYLFNCYFISSTTIDLKRSRSSMVVGFWLCFKLLSEMWGLHLLWSHPWILDIGNTCVCVFFCFFNSGQALHIIYHRSFNVQIFYAGCLAVIASVLKKSYSILSWYQILLVAILAVLLIVKWQLELLLFSLVSNFVSLRLY